MLSMICLNIEVFFLVFHLNYDYKYGEIDLNDLVNQTNVNQHFFRHQLMSLLVNQEFSLFFALPVRYNNCLCT